MTRILVVDDEAEIRSLLGAILQSKGYEVAAAEDGAAALRQVQREQPDVVLLDLSMPRMSGMEALPEIRRLAPDVPIVICTAHADLATAVRAMKLGAYDYLTKPFDVELLAITVSRAVERGELRSRIDELKRLGPAGSLARADGWRPRDPAGDPTGRPGGRVQLHGPGPGRDRNGQGAGRARHPSAEHARAGPVRGGGLRRDPGDTGGVGAVRTRARGLHGGAGEARGALPARPGRHALPRRDWQRASRDPGQAAPGPRAARGASARQCARGGDRCPDHRRHEHRPRRRGEARPLSCRSLLPAERVHDHAAASPQPP